MRAGFHNCAGALDPGFYLVPGLLLFYILFIWDRSEILLLHWNWLSVFNRLNFRVVFYSLFLELGFNVLILELCLFFQI